SDGASFTSSGGDMVSLTLSPSGPDHSGDPYVFFDGTVYNFYNPTATTTGAFSQNMFLYTSPNLSGPYTLSSNVPGGVLVPNPGGIGSGFYNSARGQYWTYIHKPESLNQIYRAVTPNLTQQIQSASFTSVASGSGLGLGAVALQHPGIRPNW